MSNKAAGPESTKGLLTAMGKEKDAADKVAAALVAARESLEKLDVSDHRRALKQAKTAFDELIRCATYRNAVGARHATSVGLARDASLAQVIYGLSGKDGALIDAAAYLKESLDAVRLEMNAQALSARHGMAMASSMLELRGGVASHTPYGPGGKRPAHRPSPGAVA